MRRFSLRQFALLTLPCLVFPLAAWLVSRAPSSQNGIEIVESARRAPTAHAFSQGADVGATVKLNERPDNNTDAAWNTFFRVDAGNHVLWNSKDGDGARKISISASQFSGAWNEWRGDFSLKTVPPEWGAVVLTWQAQLTHGRQFSTPLHNFSLAPQKSFKRGEIVLRKTGERLDYGAQIDRNPHLKIIDYEVSRFKRLKNGSIYRIRLWCRRDDSAEVDFGQRFYREVELRGVMKAWPQEKNLYGSYGGREDVYNFPSVAVEKANRISTFTQDFEVSEHPRRARIAWKLIYRDGWPLQFSVPFTDEQGRVLLRKSRTKLPAQWVR